MQKKRSRRSLICVCICCLLTGIGGFAFGWDIAAITNDSDRIVARLSQMKTYNGEDLTEITKSTEGFTEAMLIGDFLEEFQEKTEELKAQGEKLDEYLDKGIDTGSISYLQIQWVKYNQDNEKTYQALSDMVNDEEEYIYNYVDTLYHGRYEAWVEDWCEDLKHANYKAEFEEKVKPVYEANVEKLGRLRDIMEQVQEADK